MIIDTHHHLWQYNTRDFPWMNERMNVLRRDFLPADLEPLLRQSDVAGAVAVQARQTIEETRWLLSLADVNRYIAGVVGWAPLIDPGLAEYLELYAGHPKLKGLRHIVHDEPDDDYMLGDAFNRGIDLLQPYGLVYDILIFERHLPQTIEFVDRHPNQVFVLDHIGKPCIRDRVLSPWKERLRQLAKRGNIYCKVSGMATEANWSTWTAADFAPYMDTVLDAFGPKRLMFGSDWPVLTLAGNYPVWIDTFRGLTAGLSDEEQSWICHRTAAEAYRLDLEGLQS